MFFWCVADLFGKDVRGFGGAEKLKDWSVLGVSSEGASVYVSEVGGVCVWRLSRGALRVVRLSLCARRRMQL